MYHLRMATGDVVGPYMGDRAENNRDALRQRSQRRRSGLAALGAHPEFSAFVDGATSRAQWTMRRSLQAAPPIRTCRSSWACRCAYGRQPRIEVTHEEAPAKGSGGRRKLPSAPQASVLGVAAWQLGVLDSSGGSAAGQRAALLAGGRHLVSLCAHQRV